jgi:hypothetical protein
MARFTAKTASGPTKERNTVARPRKAPGSTGKGDYYHIQVRSRTGYVAFRTQDVGAPGHIQRVAGRTAAGSWSTVKWLIGKADAHVEGGRLVPTTRAARSVLEELDTEPIHLRGDLFKARSRANMPAPEKPAPAQQSARDKSSARRGTAHSKAL